MQMASGVTLVLMAGSTVTLTDAVSVQPLELVTVTVYVALDEGATVMVVLVWPLLHRYVVPPEAVRVWELPMQMVEEDEITGVGSEFTVTVMLVSSVQKPLITVIE